MNNELEVTPNQQRFLAMKELGTARNTVPVILRIEGELDAASLEKSLQLIVDRHDSLRTVFKKKDALRYRRVVLGALRVRLRRFKRVKDVDAFIERRFRRRFDGFRAPLFDFFVVEERDRVFRLCCLFDHSIFDGVSASVFVRELGTYYGALAAGDDPVVEAPRDASCARAEDIEETVAECLPYWREKLAGRTNYPELFTEAPRPREMTHESEHCFLELPRALVNGIKGLSVAEGTTVFTLIAAALNIVIFKYTRKDFVNIGIVSSGRRRGADRDAAIGCFMNNAVLSSDVSADRTCRDLIAGIRKGMQELHEHEDIPFDRLAKELRIPSDRSRNPLFQLLLNWYPRNESSEFGGLRADPIIPLQEAHFDLTLYVFRSEGRIPLNLNYNKRLFTARRSMEFLHEVQVVLEQMVANPEARIGGMSLLSDDFERTLPRLSKPMRDSYQGSVLDSVDSSIKRYGERIALTDESGRWTYSEFGRAVQSVSESLRGLRNVAVLTGRNALLPICAVSVLREGATLEILDPEYPASRLREILDTVRPDLVLITESTKEQFEAVRSDFPARQLPISKEAFFATAPPRELEPGARFKNDVDAYVLFSSGSTGRPKAIVNTLRPLSQFIEWYSSTYSFSKNDRFSMISGLSHDPILRDIFAPLACGAELAIPKNESIVNPAEFLAWIHDERVSVMHLTPAHVRILLMNDDFGAKASRLKRLFVGGDKLSGELVHEVRKRAPHLRLTNFYGATETPQAMAHYEVDAEFPGNAPIGKGRDGCDVLVMDGGRLCGMGEIGEVVIRSPYLSKGYLGDPDATSRKFIQNPLVKDRDLLYLTGDTGRFLADGSAECIGRNDDQVKMNGVRIELGEIDAVLRRHPDVVGCVTLIKEEDGEKRLVAYYAARNESGADPSAMKDYFERCLPGCMIPAEVVKVEKFPLTPNGKVDKQKLLALKAAPPAPAGEDDVDVEFVRGVFPFIRRNQAVRGGDTFNTLGGDSLSFIQSSILLERYLGHLPKNWENVPLRELRKGGTRVRGGPSLDITELIRAASIILIVLGHAKLLGTDLFSGNVAILFTIAGFSFARFKGVSLASGKWLGSLSSFLGNILVPYWIVIVAYQVFRRSVNVPDLLLFTNIIGEEHSTAIFYVFFIQVLAQSLVLISALFSLKWTQRLLREKAWGISLAMLAVSFAFFLGGHYLGASERTPNYYLWMIIMGWTVIYADSVERKAILSGAILVMAALTYLSFGEVVHGPLNACAIAVLVMWVRSVPCPLIVKKGIQYLAASTYIIYLTHLAVFGAIWAAFDRNMPWVFSIVAIGSAIACQILLDKARLSLNGRRDLKSRRASRARTGTPSAGMKGAPRSRGAPASRRLTEAETAQTSP